MAKGDRGDWLVPTTSVRLDHAAAVARLADYAVVCLDETHDRADIHRWQLHVAAGLLGRRGRIAMGFEMFPRDGCSPCSTAGSSGTSTKPPSRGASP